MNKVRTYIVYIDTIKFEVIEELKLRKKYYKNFKTENTIEIFLQYG